MKNYTKVPNEMLNASQLSISARYLYCVLLQHCCKDDHCFPGQARLANILNMSDRNIRNILGELIKNNLIYKRRLGYNQTNTYTVAKSLEQERKGNTYHIGSTFPLNNGNNFPTKSTYIKGKGKRSIKGFENLREDLTKRGILK